MATEISIKTIPKVLLWIGFRLDWPRHHRTAITISSNISPPSPPASPPPPPPPCRPVTVRSSIMDILHARSGSQLDRSAHVKQQNGMDRSSQLASHVINSLDSRFCLQRTEVMRHCIQQDEMVTSPTSPPQLKHAGRKCCPD